MKKFVCYFSGWFSDDPENVQLTDTQTGEEKSAQTWLNERGNIDGLILTDFANASREADDGAFEDLTLKIEENI